MAVLGLIQMYPKFLTHRGRLHGFLTLWQLENECQISLPVMGVIQCANGTSKSVATIKPDR